MNKELLEELNNLNNENVVYVYKDYWNKIQKKLKALEIIKEKRVDVPILISYIKECPDDEWALKKYNSLCEDRMNCKSYEGREYLISLPLSIQEYELLKEELL